MCLGADLDATENFEEVQIFHVVADSPDVEPVPSVRQDPMLSPMCLAPPRVGQSAEQYKAKVAWQDQHEPEPEASSSRSSFSLGEILAPGDLEHQESKGDVPKIRHIKVESGKEEGLRSGGMGMPIMGPSISNWSTVTGMTPCPFVPIPSGLSELEEKENAARAPAHGGTSKKARRPRKRVSWLPADLEDEVLGVYTSEHEVIPYCEIYGREPHLFEFNEAGLMVSVAEAPPTPLDPKGYPISMTAVQVIQRDRILAWATAY